MGWIQPRNEKEAQYHYKMAGVKNERQHLKLKRDLVSVSKIIGRSQILESFRWSEHSRKNLDGREDLVTSLE